MKKVISLILSAVLCLSAFFCAVSAEIEPPAVEWNYDNSILVTVSTANQRAFTPADFPEIDCKAVYYANLEKTENGYKYDLILQLPEMNDEAADEAVESVKSNPLVSECMRNTYAYSGYIEHNHSFVLLRKGHTFNVDIQKFRDEVSFKESYNLLFKISATTYQKMLKRTKTPCLNMA